MWECRECGTGVEEPFEVCFNCGTSKDGVEDPTFRSADEVPARSAGETVAQFSLRSLLCVATAVCVVSAALSSNVPVLLPVGLLVWVLLVLYVSSWVAYAVAHLIRRSEQVRNLVLLAMWLAIAHFCVCIGYFQVRETMAGPGYREFDLIGFVLLLPASLVLVVFSDSGGLFLIVLCLNHCFWGLTLAGLVHWIRGLVAMAGQEAR